MCANDMSDELIEACDDLNYIVEGLGMKNWRDENGIRLKDTPEWVRFYVALKTDDVQVLLERIRKENAEDIVTAFERIKANKLS